MVTRIAVDAEPIPGYRLVERIGRGGFGEVWKVQAPGGMLKAMKFVYGSLDEATENGKPAEQELKALNRVKSLRHPYILSLERFDVVDGQLVIVMELADRNLFDRYRECHERGLPGIPRDELLRYMEETAEALDLMNSQFQLQHLDIKPQNIFLVFNHVKVADFGLAKDLEGMQATLTGGVTPVYAAPETFECRVTRYCDQYSLAIVYQEMLTGERPFNGTTARQLMMQHIQSPPDLSSLPPPDRPIIARALSKKAEDRYGSCHDLIRSLLEAGRPPSVTPDDQTPVPANVPPARPTPVSSLSDSPRPDPGGLSLLGLKSTPGSLPSLSGAAKLPPLLTQRAVAANAALANAREAPSELVGNGVLFPALIIGLGKFGLLVMQRLRRTFRDRFGSASLPHLRMLYIDTNPETLRSISSSSSAVDPSEVYLARLNRPAHYNQSRPDLPPISTWLNPQMLYRIPREPITTGTRAFGRLALCDHYRAIMAKVRENIEGCVTADALADAAEKTGQSLRSNRPRVYIVASLMGGTGSGMFLDMAYALRFQLRMLGYKEPEVHGLLYVPQVDRETPRSQAVANSYAAITELLHFNAPGTTYEALFDTKEGQIVDRERPFQRCMILQLPTSADPAVLRPVLGTGAGFLFHEMFTPIGREADKARAKLPGGSSSQSHLQTCGTFRLTWPRRSLLERSARLCCARVLAGWSVVDAPHLVEPVGAWLQQNWDAQQFDSGTMIERLSSACRESLQDEPIRMLDNVIDPIDLKERYPTLELSELCQVLERITHLVGQPDNDMSVSTGRLGQVLDHVSRVIASEVERQLSSLALSMVDHPGCRLAGAEEVIRQATPLVRQILEPLELRLERFHHESRDAYVKVYNLMTSLETMSRGSRKIAVTRDVVGHMRHFARKRQEFLIHRALVTIYRVLANFGSDCQREVNALRQKLETVQQALVRPSSSGPHGYLGAERAVLPPGCMDLGEAAECVVSTLTLEDLLRLEQDMQAEICQKFDSAAGFIRDSSDQTRSLTATLVEKARVFLEPRIMAMNPASVIFAGQEEAQSARQEAATGYELARPVLCGSNPRPDKERCMLGVPDDDDGKRFAAAARELIPSQQLVSVPGTDDIIFHREVEGLLPGDLPQVGPIAREAFVHISHADQVSPHTRIDVSWQPVNR